MLTKYCYGFKWKFFGSKEKQISQNDFDVECSQQNSEQCKISLEIIQASTQRSDLKMQKLKLDKESRLFSDWVRNSVHAFNRQKMAKLLRIYSNKAISNSGR